MISVIKVSEDEVAKLLSIEEGHFSELKSKDVKPGSLTKTISAFSNSEGGSFMWG